MCQSTAMKKGFTLIEVLVAATIIAVLISIGVVSYASVNKRSRDAKRKSDIEQLRSALEMYRSDYGSYPANPLAPNFDNVSVLQDALVTTDAYMPSLPSDPKSTQKYRYKATSLYAYCISAVLENGSVDSIDSCVDEDTEDHNYGVKNP